MQKRTQPGMPVVKTSGPKISDFYSGLNLGSDEQVAVKASLKRFRSEVKNGLKSGDASAKRAKLKEIDKVTCEELSTKLGKHRFEQFMKKVAALR
jgi:hypothetical protein